MPCNHKQATSIDNALASRHLPGLDGVRAISVLAVIMSHAGLVPIGSLGVNVFFVLSGFLITWLLIKEWNSSSDISLSSFYYRRVLRIFPAYYFFILVSVSADLFLGNNEVKPAIIPALTYTINYFNVFNDHPSLSIAHAWSLAIEEQFYILWPLLLLVALRYFRRHLIWLLVALIVSVVIWRSIAYIYLMLGTSYAYNAFEARFDSLAIGCLLAVLLRTRGFRRFIGFLSIQRFLPAMMIVTVLLLHLLGSSSYRYTVGVTIAALLVAILLPLLMIGATNGTFRWLEHPAVKYVGIISYPMYLWHARSLEIAGMLGAKSPIVLTIYGTILCLFVASASYKWIETPFLSLKNIKR